MKRISEKRFYFTFNERFFWSKAFQSLTPSAINLMMCFQTELRWSKGKRRSKRNILNNGNISFSEAEYRFNKLGASQIEDWEHEIPKVKDYAVGRSTRFKKINNTLESDTLNGTKSPKSLDPSLETSPND